ncbi:MAG TPA: ferredoxin--NADP reductase, partial [Stenotrophomonas sp.]
MPSSFPLKLVERRMLAPAVGHYAFVRDDGLPLDFVPGQYIHVHFRDGDGETLRRS